MEFVSRFASGSRWAALMACACLLPAVVTAGPDGGEAAAAREASRRAQQFDEARVLLENGDFAYAKGEYATAVTAYRGAFDRLTHAPQTAQIKAAARDRLVVASIEQSHVMTRKGDVAGAKALLNGLLAADVAPGDAKVKCELDLLNDPIRTNPALTAEHGKEVDQVRRLLYLTEGSFNLGLFDQAKRHGEAIIRIDPYNTAARRWMERIASAKSGYAKAAYDQTRAEKLSEVDAAWELKLAPVAPAMGDGAASTTNPAGQASIEQRLNRQIIPVVDFDQTNLNEALDFLRASVAKPEVPGDAGINFVFAPSNKEAGEAVLRKKFDLKLRQVPVSQVLRYIADATGTDFSFDDYAVRFHSEVGANSGAMVIRSYRVPPDFITTLSASSGDNGSAVVADPFAPKPAGGLIAQRRNAQDLLKENGVPFPEGANARFDASTSTLVVRNSSVNHELLAQLIQAHTKSDPVQVLVRVTMLRTKQENLNELGFDWLAAPFDIGKNLVGSGGTTGNGGDLSDLTIPGDGLQPVTAGNRSGGSAISLDDGIDAVLRRDSSFGNPAARAPGVFGLNGKLDDPTFKVVMRALSQKKNTDLMAQPSVVTRSGQAASVEVMREFMYPDEYEPPEVPNDVGRGVMPITPAHPSSFIKRPIGITLEVLPTASEDKHFIDVALNPRITEFDGFVNYGSPISAPNLGLLNDRGTVVLSENRILKPVISSYRANTKLNVADGSTLVIGGLQQQRVQTIEDKTPILGDLPGIGRLFQSKAKSNVTHVVLFFVQVELLDPTGHPYRQR